MKIEHLEERVKDYQDSIETVVNKRSQWNTKTKKILLATLNDVVKHYDIGWKVQELSWIHNNEAVNITFESFPHELIECTNQIPAYQFIPGGALIFSQTYSGDVAIIMLYPEIENVPREHTTQEFGVYAPDLLVKKLIIEKIDEFLKEIIKWEVPSTKKKVGY